MTLHGYSFSWLYLSPIYVNTLRKIFGAIRQMISYHSYISTRSSVVILRLEFKESFA
jgi:hypothetical protein